MNSGCRPFTEEELGKLLADDSPMSERDKLFVALACSTGFRVSELLTLRIEDIQGESITIRRSNVKAKVANRNIPLGDTIKQRLAFYLLTQPAEGWLFPSRKGEAAVSACQIWRSINKAMQELGFDTNRVGTHSCRKTFALKVYEALGKDVARLQYALGHRWITSTQAYISFAEKDVDDTIRSLF